MWRAPAPRALPQRQQHPRSSPRSPESGRHDVATPAPGALLPRQQCSQPPLGRLSWGAMTGSQAQANLPKAGRARTPPVRHRKRGSSHPAQGWQLPSAEQKGNKGRRENRGRGGEKQGWKTLEKDREKEPAAALGREGEVRCSNHPPHYF